MFKKAFVVNLRNTVSGADRKKLRRGIEKCFEHLTEDEVDLLLPSKAGELEQLKLAAPARGVIYLLDKVPVLIDPTGKGEIVPTVNSLWRVPHLLPRVYVKHPGVTSYMVGGADLMLPGAHVPPGGLPAFEKGDLVSICVHGNPAPLAVGYAALNSVDVKETSSSKGKLIELIQYYGDQLWEEQGGKAVPNAGYIAGYVVPLGYDNVEQTLKGLFSFPAASNGSEPPPQPCPLNAGSSNSPASAAAAADSTAALTAAVADLSTGPSPAGASGAPFDAADRAAGTPSSGNAAPSSSGLQAAEQGGDGGGGSGVAPFPPEDVDALLELVLLQALHRSLKDTDLPANSNVLWTQHMLPCRPAGTALDVKKSKHKKMSKWLTSYGKSHGLLSVKEERNSGDVVVTAVHRQHTLYTTFRPYKAALQESAAAGSDASASAGDKAGGNAGGGGHADSSSTSGGGGLLIEEMFKPTKETKPLFAALNLDADALYTAQETGEAVFAYVKAAGLEASAPDATTVVLDVTLCDALFKGVIKKGDSFPTHHPKALLREALQGRMQMQCRISRGTDQVLKKGGSPLVQVTKEKHRGHTVTRIVGMENFLVDSKQFGSECQRKFACSTTVTDLPGKGATGMEVLIQGDVSEHLGDYITATWHIPKKYITGCGKQK